MAETFEQALAAVALVQPRYAPAFSMCDLGAEKGRLPPPCSKSDSKPDPRLSSSRGDFDCAFNEAEVTVEAMYTTPDHSHAMLETHATIAAWNGDKLTLHTAIQMVGWGVRDLAKILGIAKEKIYIVTPNIGCGLGGEGSSLNDAVLASLAAKRIGRSVKVSLQRPLMFNHQAPRGHHLTYPPGRHQGWQTGCYRPRKLVWQSQWPSGIDHRPYAAVMCRRQPLLNDTQADPESPENRPWAVRWRRLSAARLSRQRRGK